MTRATWNRLDRLEEASIAADDAYDQEKAERISECIDRLLNKAGIVQYLPDWDMISVSWSEGTIEVYDSKGELIRAYNVFETKRQVA